MLRGEAPATPTTLDSLLRAVARVEPLPVIGAGEILGGNYEVVERLGAGGMGVVYRARDLRLGRDVAVKVLRTTDHESMDHRRQLLAREARATAQLLHPNIVTLHHVGDHHGIPFLVLELLAGETLAARLARKGRLPLVEALSILDGVLAALGFAHERGVLHRDLKPNNVFVTGDERVKVLDFGVAVSLDTDPGPVTRSAGTPGYMAPEQRDGSAQDARTDVWAAAVLLVECLTGRRPDAGTVTVDGRGAAARGVDAGQLDDVPREVAAVLARALSPDPTLRPGSAADLRAALSRAMTPPRRRRRPRRHVVAAAMAGALLGGGAAWSVRASPIATSETNQGVGAGEISGLWNGGFGLMYLAVAADGSVRGTYEHEEGVLVGRWDGTVLRAWWCELPSRGAPLDAGEVEMRFNRDRRAISLDGRWRYGGDAPSPWHEDWDASTVATGFDPLVERQLVQRLQTASCADRSHR